MNDWTPLPIMVKMDAVEWCTFGLANEQLVHEIISRDTGRCHQSVTMMIVITALNNAAVHKCRRYTQ